MEHGIQPTIMWHWGMHESLCSKCQSLWDNMSKQERTDLKKAYLFDGWK